MVSGISSDLKLVCKQRHKLVLHNSPILMRLGGALLMTLGCVHLWASGSRELHCDRFTRSKQVECELIEYQAMGLARTRKISLGHLHDISLDRQSIPDRGKRRSVYQIRLNGSFGKTTMPPYYSGNADSIASIANKIERYLQDANQSSLKIRENNWAPALASFFWLPLGIAMQLSLATFTFDKTAGVFTLKRRRSFFGHHDSAVEYSLNEIRGVAIEKRQEGGEVDFCVSLIVKDNQYQPLKETYHSKLDRVKQTAEILREFLRLPPVVAARDLHP